MVGAKWGWALAGFYGLVSVSCIYGIAQCEDDFFCGIWALPMLVPSGFAYLAVFADHLPSPAILQWPLLLATVLTNLVLYFALGMMLGRWLRSRRRPLRD